MPRGHVELVHAPEIAAVEFPVGGWPVGARYKILSSDPESGAFTAVLLLPAGYRRTAGHLSSETELYVLGGTLRVGETTCGAGYYEYALPGSTVEEWTAVEPCEILFMARGEPPEFLSGPGRGGSEGRVQIDTETMPWMNTTIPGLSPGVCLKVLREVPATGEAVFIMGLMPG